MVYRDQISYADKQIDRLEDSEAVRSPASEFGRSQDNLIP